MKIAPAFAHTDARAHARLPLFRISYHKWRSLLPDAKPLFLKLAVIILDLPRILPSSQAYTDSFHHTETVIMMSDINCQVCHKTQAELPQLLRRCAKCQTELYCSRYCQKADWKERKKAWGKQGPVSGTK